MPIDRPEYHAQGDATEREPIRKCANRAKLGIAAEGNDFHVPTPFLFGLGALDQNFEAFARIVFGRAPARRVRCGEAADETEQDQRAITYPSKPWRQRLDYGCSSGALSGAFFCDAVPKRRRIPRQVFSTLGSSLGEGWPARSCS